VIISAQSFNPLVLEVDVQRAFVMKEIIFFNNLDEFEASRF
jgi:hypothetical protein